MCWVENSKTVPKLLIADRDIPVKKLLTTKLCSPIYGTKWEFGKVQISKIGDPDIRGSLWHIEKGLHSSKGIYKNYFGWCCSNNIINTDEECKIFDAIIPKGAQYYKNKEGGYVSDKLIISTPTL